ncbi:uncharacterized protein [Oryza sativa Japonica Group]|uniref:DUF295 domain-containing protein n=2 Tax=Oryza TaxID=4527 RepID=Q5VPK1_ORYSJ|nr:uncharacterized protein LOC4340133 [Oryza sativa Japonica Group]EAZ35834.1 hypothetical protein OsJ_20130 [Oryza sativa Japonica Group]KAF2925199.1 hypothetical protein DAI22_06g034900 [Oryza sativa Japonica Group]USI00210.1 F-box and DUF domain-containing protein [Oryza sativa Japonica Group]BAD68624.1 hypothetical protein [Oryza sativa Japonica Group]
MAAQRPCNGGSWPDLPSELLGLVLLRLPSHGDRVRLRAVCRPWRSSARLERKLLPPPLPWLFLPDGAFLTLPDGAAHRRLAIPGDVAHLVPTGSGLLLAHNDGMFSLMNPSSSATTPLPDLAAVFHGEIKCKYPDTAFQLGQRRITPIIKAVVSEHFIAFYFNSSKVIITSGQPHTVVKWSPPDSSYILDIALFQGKLYCLTFDIENCQEELYILEVRDEEPMVSDVKCIHSTPRDVGDEDEAWFNPHSTDRYTFHRYLVADGDRLLMVARWINLNLPPMLPRDSSIKRTRRFDVFEAVDLSSEHGRWIKVDTLMGHSLFVSESCSESLTAGAEEDCIYFMNDGIMNRIPKDPLSDSGVYNMRDGMVAPLMPETAVTEHLAAHDGPWFSTWLFPTET